MSQEEALERIDRAKQEGAIELDLSNLRLKSVPEVIGQLSNLQELDLSNNQLTSVPEVIGQLSNLQKLNLSSNQLTSVPEVIGQLSNLQLLNLGNNQLTSVSEVIGQLSNLQLLNLGNNQLTSVPEVIGQLSNLQQLYLSDNKLTSVPEFIGQLSNLQELNLDHNQLTSVPEVIGQLSNLQELYLSDNQLTSVPEVIGQLSNLQQLSLLDNQLTSVPEVIGQLSNLQGLYLGNNQLTSVPEFIGQLSNLQVLFLDQNQLTSVPEGIGQLSNLQVFFLDNNQLTSVPEVIGQLSNLQQLDLGNNPLTSVPEVIGQLSNLQVLFLDNNQLTSVPEVIGQLSNLQQLDLGNNPLTSVPEVIGQLSNLQELSLYNNQLTSVPEFIGQLSNLQELDLDHNPLCSPPLEVANRGVIAIQNYLNSLEDESKVLNEVKILLVGEGSAGKTSLVKQVLGEEFNQNEPTTHGIRINDWSVNDVKVNIWDFGGQEIMHATHQFFLSKRSLYVLVLDGRRDERPEYWLRHIESFGGNSPVLIVLNKYDANPGYDINRPFLMQKYPGIQAIYRTSCSSGHGIAEFKQALQQSLTEVKLIATRWPKSWFTIKQQLEQLQDHYISAEQYEKLCTAATITEPISQDVLVEFLHDLGVIVHFKEFALGDTHVLEPKWVTTAVYKIINSEQIANSKGILHLSDLRNILKKATEADYFYPRSKYPYIICLMKKFELCYDLTAESVLIPQLLSVREPKFEFDYENSLKFILSYTDFLPLSIMSRFIVKRHKDIKNNLQWRTGVVLKNHDFQATAVIRADNEAKRINIYVNGNQPKDYLTIIRLFFGEINSSFEKLKVDEQVPMPDNPELTANYRNLLAYARKGQDFYIPIGSEEQYSVKQLLGLVQFDATENELKILEILQEIKDEVKDERSITQIFDLVQFDIARDNQKVLEILQEIKDEVKDEESITQIFDFKPGIGGFSIDIIKLFRQISRKKKQSRD